MAVLYAAHCRIYEIEQEIFVEEFFGRFVELVYIHRIDILFRLAEHDVTYSEKVGFCARTGRICNAFEFFKAGTALVVYDGSAVAALLSVGFYCGYQLLHLCRGSKHEGMQRIFCKLHHRFKAGAHVYLLPLVEHKEQVFNLCRKLHCRAGRFVVLTLQTAAVYTEIIESFALFRVGGNFVCGAVALVGLVHSNAKHFKAGVELVPAGALADLTL